MPPKGWSVTALYFNRVCRLLQNLLKPLIVTAPPIKKNIYIIFFLGKNILASLDAYEKLTSHVLKIKKKYANALQRNASMHFTEKYFGVRWTLNAEFKWLTTVYSSFRWEINILNENYVSILTFRHAGHNPFSSVLMRCQQNRQICWLRESISSVHLITWINTWMTCPIFRAVKQ